MSGNVSFYINFDTFSLKEFRKLSPNNKIADMIVLSVTCNHFVVYIIAIEMLTSLNDNNNIITK